MLVCICVYNKVITDQHITKGAESLHADLAPLVCEEDIFQPFVNHRVHFLQPWRKMTNDKAKGQKQTQTHVEIMRQSFDNVMVDYWIEDYHRHRERDIQKWAWQLISGIVSSGDVGQVNINGHFKFGYCGWLLHHKTLTR